jgi:V-type H+-transporting ATPase subunit a
MYKEINPAVFACVSFPFLFGVMFGDMGHGSILFIVGSLLCIFDKQVKASSMKDFAMLRYLLLMMGFFAIFNGFIYNEFFAIPIDFFGSCFSKTTVQYNQTNKNISAEGYNKTDFNCVYPMGVDPRWA